MKWLLIYVLFLVTEVTAEDSILMDKKSIVNQVRTYNNVSMVNESTEVSQSEKLSDKYLRKYNEILAIENLTNKSKWLININRMIKYAKQYENNLMSKDEFDDLLRDAKAEIESLKEELNSNTTEKSDTSDYNLNSERLKIPDYQFKADKPINCITSRVGETTYTNCQ